MRRGWYRSRMLLPVRCGLGAAILSLPLLTGGCAALWGKTTLTPEPGRYVALAAPGALSLQLLEGTIAPRERVETLVTAHYPLFGIISRTVSPYPREWAVFDLALRNPSPTEAVEVMPEPASLTVAGRPWAPVTPETAREAWPGYAAEDADSSADRQAAYVRVLETLLLPRRLAPGAAFTATLAFVPPAPGPVAGGPAELRLPVRAEGGKAGACRLKLQHWGLR